MIFSTSSSFEILFCKYKGIQAYASPKDWIFFQESPCPCSFSTSSIIPSLNLASTRFSIFSCNLSFGSLRPIWRNWYSVFRREPSTRLGTPVLTGTFPMALQISIARINLTLFFASIFFALSGSNFLSIENNFSADNFSSFSRNFQSGLT